MYDLYEIAEKNGIGIYTGNIPLTVSMCVPGAVALDFRLIDSPTEERTRLGHELGHCCMNAFYERSDPAYIKKRCENRADRWAIRQLIPRDALLDAVRRGITAPWELAEYFGVTEQLLRKAIWFYEKGNMSIEEELACQNS